MRLTTRTNLAMRTLMFCAVNPDRVVRKAEIAQEEAEQTGGTGWTP